MFELPTEVYMAITLAPVVLATMLLAVVYLCLGLSKFDILVMLALVNFVHWGLMEAQNYHLGNCIATANAHYDAYLWFATGPLFGPPFRWATKGISWLFKQLWKGFTSANRVSSSKPAASKP